MHLLEPHRLAAFMREQLDRLEVCPESAGHVVSALVEASVRGVDSHGVNLFPHYCESVQSGRINRNPDLRVAEQGGAVAVLDADFAFGHHAGACAMKLAMDMARQSGIGSVAVRDSSHFAAAAYYALRAAEQGFFGLAFTNADALVKAANGRSAFFGTNPICFTAPMEGEGPLCLDMATSLVSWNKIVNHRREDKALPAGWGFDGEGNPTEDPHAVRSLNPAGGYKGFGLGMMVDVLCAILASGPNSPDLLPMYADLTAKRSVSHFFIAIDPGSFGREVNAAQRVTEMAERIRALPVLDGAEAVMVPGDPEKRTAVQRSCSGIPMDPVKFAEFRALSVDVERALMP